MAGREAMDGPGARNEFIVVSGEAAGNRLVIPRGEVTVGSQDGSRLRLPAYGVSRHHALLSSVDGRTILTDQQSRNGSWVNGHRITSPTELAHGDLVQFGEVSLRFIDRNADGGTPREDGGAPREGAGKDTAKPGPQQPKERLGTALMFAAGINVIGLLGNSLTSFLTELTPTWTWFATPLVGLLVALAIEMLGFYRKNQAAARQQPASHGHAPQAGPRAEAQAGPRPEPRAEPRRPLAATVLLTLLLLGGGGWLVTAGASYAVGYFSGNESGVQRLERQVVAEAQGVRVTILGVQSTAHFTRAEILVNNGTTSTITLPLFQNAMLTGPDGTTYDADSFRSNWQPQIPPGGQRKGTLNFESQLPEGATTVSLSFATVFVQGFDGPRTITVPDIRLKPLAGSEPAAQSHQDAGR
ncbi:MULTISPECIES: FHA domain-containing protein [unclassified Arthrobacter]|uniref:FHA domain-containing protein n=1 Tax=unclassified Arthrobacter TaxID=235627 RepID=UPI0027E308AF|nr:FHA domain-containing protein [Arthrobacter sp. MAHUQ-56]